MRLLTLSRVGLGLVLVVAGFGAAFAIGSATAGSDRGEVGQPKLVQVASDDAHVPTLKKVEPLPALRVPDSAPEPDRGPTTTTVDPPPKPTPNKAPVASIAVSADTVLTDETVRFDASDSKDPDGSIANYKWDLDGDGSYETNTRMVQIATRTYPDAGSVTVRLQVTDDDDATDTATETITVNAPPTEEPRHEKLSSRATPQS